MSGDENIPGDEVSEFGDSTEPVTAGDSIDDAAPELSEVEALKAELEHARADAEKAREEGLRARAEADNVRKRAERDVSAAHKFGLERFVGTLLPVKDGMDLGFDALDSSTDIDAIREGMSLTAKMFDDALNKAGVSAIDPTGEAFNPEFHQAMTMQPASDVAPGTILSVMQKGYLLNDRLIRPAMVIVAKAIEDEAE